MAFELRKDARAWFKDVALEMDFDAYYFCLLAGLATGSKREVPSADTAEIVQHFPGDYRPKGRLIVALFLKVELERLGVTMDERAAVHQTIRQLVNPTSATWLSDSGLREMNRYAHGGFEVLTEWFEVRPRTLEVFLPLFHRHLSATLAAAAQTAGSQRVQ